MHFTEEVCIGELYIYIYMYIYIYIYKLIIGLILFSNGFVRYVTALGAWKSPYGGSRAEPQDALEFIDFQEKVSLRYKERLFLQ